MCHIDVDNDMMFSLYSYNKHIDVALSPVHTKRVDTFG